MPVSYTHLYELPFTLRPFQVDAVNYLAPLTRTGLYLEPGLGKTVVCTVCALYKRITGQTEITIGIMPPLLVTQWARWLAKVKPKKGGRCV